MTPWISPRDLLARMADPNLRLFDVRFSLADPEAGRRAYTQGHIPGAVYLDLDRDLSSPVGAHGGRHPLPNVDALARTLGASGVDADAWVVVYDDADGMFAGRLWWLLRWLGHARVQVLDGGAAAWRAAAGAWTPDVARPHARTFVPRPNPEMLVDRAWMLEHGQNEGVRVVDARAPERYRGDIEPIDPVGGHIPGAINRPFAANLADGRFKSPEALAGRFHDLRDAQTLVVYCGSGVSAAHNVMAMEAAGIQGVRLYAGSWSDWVSYPNATVARDDDPTRV
jgi:thiosulfate/3-mercaptopyruvate sulfurtransferase